VDRSLTNPFSLTAHAGKAAIWPGQVAEKLVGNVVQVMVSGTAQRAMGLFANFVGGTLSDIPAEEDAVGVWRGTGSVWEVLAPVFDDTGLSAAAGAEAGAAAGTDEVYLKAGATGRLILTAGPEDALSQARLLQRYSANAIEIELLV